MRSAARSPNWRRPTDHGDRLQAHLLRSSPRLLDERPDDRLLVGRGEMSLARLGLVAEILQPWDRNGLLQPDARG